MTTDLSVTGKPAQFGRGVMQDVSDKLLQQFVECLERQFAAAGGAGQSRLAPPRRPPDEPAPVPDRGLDRPGGHGRCPVLARRYGPYAVAALVGLVLGWLLGRRG